MATKKKLAKEAVRAALEIGLARLHDEIDLFEMFGVRLPDVEDPLFVFLTASREVALYAGPGAFGAAIAWLRDPDSPVPPGCVSLGTYLAPLREIPPEQRRTLDLAGFQSRRDSPAPGFAVRRPDGREGEPVAAELALLAPALRAILAAHSEGLLDPLSVAEGGDVLVLSTDGDLRRPAVRAEWETWHPDGRVRIDTPRDAYRRVAALPRLGGLWEVALPLAGTDEVPMLFVAGTEPKKLLAVAPFRQSPVEGAAERLFRAFEGESEEGGIGVPDEVVFGTRALLDAAGPALRAAGIACSHDPRPPVASGYALGMSAAMLDLGEEFREEELEGLTPAGHVPEPGDLAGWKAAERLFVSSFVRRIAVEGLRSDRAFEEYFGDTEVGAELVETREGQGAGQAFLEFLLTDCRPPRGRPTLAERLLAGPLRPDAEMLLRARLEAAPSVYRVVEVTPGESLLLEDLATGERVTVMEAGLGESVHPDWLLPLRVIRAGDFRFCAMYGPPVGPADAPRALQVLEEEGLALTPEGLKAAPQLLGRLWEWYDAEVVDRPFPRLANTDGEDLVFHTASWRILRAKGREVVDALCALPGIEYDEAENTFRWSRQGFSGDEEMMTSLGAIEWLGDELVANVNSAGRFERLREMLADLPFLEFMEVRRREFDDVLGGPLDDRLPSREPPPDSPEIRRVMDDMLRRHYRRWLDEPLPALGGLTPREAARTKDGRRRVRDLVRFIPSPGGPTDLDMDELKAGLLRELGLD